MFNDPFVRLIVYLLLTWGVVWVLGEVLRQSGVEPRPTRISLVVVGVVLVIIAFYLSGILGLLQ